MLLRPLLAFTILGLSTLASALTANAGLPRDCYLSNPGYELQMFREQENQMISWQNIYYNSSSGSSREREANIKRRAHADAALSVIQNRDSLYRYPHQTISNFADEMTNKLYNSSSGGVLEQTYRSALNISLQAFVEKGSENLRCETLSGEETLNGAIVYENLLYNASSGSAREFAFRQLRNLAYQTAGDKLEQEYRYGGMDFRSLQNQAIQMHNRYYNASSGSVAENLFRRVRDVALDAALETFRGQIAYISMPQLAQLENEFQNQYYNASSGSKLESHYRSMRDQCRSEINRRSYQPMPQPRYPVPVPVPMPQSPRPVPPVYNPRPVPAPNRCPDPNTRFDTRIGRCVANR